MNESVFMNQKFESVQSLRGIAALFVMCQHICFLQRGSFGVDLFFLISGFVIMYSTQKNKEGFLSKRLIRIVPLYYLMTFFTYAILVVKPELFEKTTASPLSLVMSLFAVPFDIDGATQPILRVGWTINYEIFFYLLFFSAMKISFRYRALICSGELALLVILGKILHPKQPALRFWTDSLILEFAIGMMFFYIAAKLYEYCGKLCEKTNIYKISRAIVCVGVSAGIFVYEWMSYSYAKISACPEIIRWGLPSLLVLALFFLAGLMIKFPKPLVLLGNMSFSLYLIHYYPMRFLNRILKDTTCPSGVQIVITLGFVVGTLLLSYLCYLLIEVRFTGYLRRKLPFLSKLERR